MRGHILFTVAVSLSAAAAPVAAADPPRKLHVLLAIDDTAGDLRNSVLIDQSRIERLLKANVPADRLALHTLGGTRLTSAKVLEHYAALKVAPGDALLFFYAGHGSKDPDKGYAFEPQLRKVPPIYRSDVREAMKRTKAGLVVILSDCCSTPSRLAGKPFFGDTRPVTPESGTGMHPTLEHLFFSHKGVVDVTAAADGESSWGDARDGGIFTRTLAAKLLCRPDDLDTNGDKLVTWAEFFPRLRKDSEGTYKTWAAKMRGLGDPIDQPNQRPQAFSLGEVLEGGAPKPAREVTVYAVVCLANESGGELKFKYRFTGQDAWQSATIPPGKRGEYSAPRGKAAELPRFEIQLEGNKSAAELETDAWSGVTTPPRGAAGKEYPIQLRKKGK